MKHFTSQKLKLITVAIIGITVSNCSKNSDSNLSATDKTASEGITTSYTLSSNYNDSLITAELGSDSARIFYCDQKFHEFENDFNNFHNNYNHNEGHSDHNHTNNTMMGDCCNHNGNHHNMDKGHHSVEHNNMDQLIENHKKYHP